MKGTYTLIEAKTYYSKEEANKVLREKYSSVSGAEVITDKGERFFIAKEKI